MEADGHVVSLSLINRFARGSDCQEIAAMRLALGQNLPPSIPSPDQIPLAATNDSQSSSAAPQ